jgi:hypothetical protein
MQARNIFQWHNTLPELISLNRCGRIFGEKLAKAA